MDGIFNIKDDNLDDSTSLSVWWCNFITKNWSYDILLFRNIKFIMKKGLRLQ